MPPSPPPLASPLCVSLVRLLIFRLTLSQCQPTLLTWTGGQAPYYVSVIEGGNPNGKAFKTWPATEATSLTWKVTEVPAGQSITVQVKDGSGAVKYSAAVTVGDGGSECSAESGDSAAAGGAASGSSGASAGGSAPSAGGAAASPSSGSAGSSNAGAAGASASPSASGKASAEKADSTGSTATKPSAGAASASAASGAGATVASVGLVAAAGALAALF